MPSLLFHPGVALAALLTLTPFFFAAFCPCSWRKLRAFPLAARLSAPALLALPYILVSASTALFRWRWLAVYALLPMLISLLFEMARRTDPEQRGQWQDCLILATLGLAVDLRWFEPAWATGLAAFNKMLLLDAGIYGFHVMRQLSDTGFDLRLRWRDLATGFVWFALYAPLAIALGLVLGFLHWHALMPSPGHILSALLFTFFFIAVPEELFFRGWMQNLLERRIGRMGALLVTAILFGLSHFNKRALHFNWRYVLLAALAGIFYGAAWRQNRRVGASAITHALVDTVWSVWLR
jgi:membrane protease YdiL (CAAX protease family)